MRRKIVDQPFPAISSAKSKPGATVQPTKQNAELWCRLAGEPATSRNNIPKQVAIFYIIAQLDGFPFPVGADEVNQQKVSLGVKMPEFIGLNAMQGGKIPFFQ